VEYVLHIPKEMPLGMDGLCGIGWGITYLYRHEYEQGSLDELLKPLDGLFENEYQMYIGEEPGTTSPYRWLAYTLGNAFLASVPNCKGWIEILKEIEASLSVYTKGRTVFDITGSSMLTRSFGKLIPYGAHAIPYQLVSPVRKYDALRYIYYNRTQEFEDKIVDAYCIHYFLGTWDEKKGMY